MSIQELSAELAAARTALLQEASRLPRTRWGERPTQEEWSVLEVVAHLIAVDGHWLFQAMAIRDRPGHLFAHFDDAAGKAEHRHPRGISWTVANVFRRFPHHDENHTRQIGEIISRLSM